MKDQEYLEKVCEALRSFQMLEEGLKIYIGLYVEVERLSGNRDEKLDSLIKDIFNTPLSYVIKRFKKTNPNGAIVSRLERKDLIEWRNFLAHNAFHHEFMSRTSTIDFSHHTAFDIAKVALDIGYLTLDLGEEIVILQKRHESLRTES
jgi:hypothetical protein